MALDVVLYRLNSYAIISNEIALEIFDLTKNSNLTTKEIGEKYNVSQQTVSLIKNGGVWSDITGETYIKKIHPNIKLTEDQVKEICNYSAYIKQHRKPSLSKFVRQISMN